MIIKGGSRSARAFFARHLMNENDNDRVRVVGFQGFAHEDVDDAFRDMEAVAKYTNCKNFFYHASMSPGQDERLTDAQWERAVDTLEKNLGLEGQSRIVFEHEKHGRVHRHVVWSRIDLDTMKARPDSLTYAKHEQSAREIEKQCELQPLASVLVKDRELPRPRRRSRDWEGFRGQRGMNPDEVKAEVTALWQESDSGPAFKAALESHAYQLCRGDRRDFCVIDPAGNEHSLARRVAGVKAAEIRERLSGIDRDTLPSVAEARSQTRADAENVKVRHEDKKFEKFMQPVILTLEEVGETALHGMGNNWWERAHMVIKEKAVALWQMAKDTWREFVRAEERGRGPQLEL
jgi:hypothetical protein